MTDAPQKPTKKRKKKKKSAASPDIARVAAPKTAPAPDKRRMYVGAAAVGVAAIAGLWIWTSLASAGGAWKVGDMVDVEITLVGADAQNLACASTEQVGGSSCAFEQEDRPKAGGRPPSDPTLLMPYTTTDRRELLASGLWQQPALQGQLPQDRFSVRCKFKVEGHLPAVKVRWSTAGPWHEAKAPWPAGPVSECTRVGP